MRSKVSILPDKKSAACARTWGGQEPNIFELAIDVFAFLTLRLGYEVNKCCLASIACL
jgi:hypothetical protein